MSPRNVDRRFGAFVEPHGIFLVEYHRERDGIAIIRRQSDERRVLGLAEAGERLAALVRAGGSGSSRLAAVMRGFGSAYQLMMLPPAEPAVLGPVVRRELTRLNPDMERPRIDFVVGGEIDRRRRARPEGGRPQQEVLVGAAPELAVSAFGDELAAAGIELEHLTLLPQVIQRLYQQGDGSPKPTACYVELPGGPLIAFFHENQLRLVVEPPIGGDSSVTSRAEILAEHLDRGNLYLRQQFRGVELGRLLIAAAPGQESELIEMLRARLGYPVAKFSGPDAPTAALVSMGAVLDAEAERGLNLSPFAESAEVRSERSNRQKAVLTAAAVSAIAIIWAILSVAGVVSLSRKVESERRVAEARMNTLAPIRVIAAQRQKNAQSIRYLDNVASDRVHTEEILRAIVRATPPGTQLTAVSLDRAGQEWNLQISGTAFGETGADVLLGVDRFYHALPRELPMHDLVLAALEDITGGDFGTAMKFTVTFVASPQGPRL
jgi:hypothetical protein